MSEVFTIITHICNVCSLIFRYMQFRMSCLAMQFFPEMV
uniref:Uncharacterized protein n=1 Tax=Anguilla anguilla TaxID=7936 RepID=A0A0E9VIB9_ANGAN